jgi:hypothetical protein
VTKLGIRGAIPPLSIYLCGVHKDKLIIYSGLITNSVGKILRKASIVVYMVKIQGDQKVSVHMMITIQKVTWLNLTAW